MKNNKLGVHVGSWPHASLYETLQFNWFDEIYNGMEIEERMEIFKIWQNKAKQKWKWEKI